MKQLIDIVNFNADASCLDCAAWLAALKGGEESAMCRWLSLYLRYGKAMVLGMTGATVSDLVQHNPEALALVRDNPQIFQVILRPYAHDISLLRTAHGFRLNFAAGRATILSAFGRACNYYLPPEFMLMSEQVAVLAGLGVQGVFINAQRYTPELADRIPGTPYLVSGILGAKLGCIPVRGELTQLYLSALQLWDAAPWNAALSQGDSPARLWRDGESPFLLPDGLEREEFWLAHCQGERMQLPVEQDYQTPSNAGHYRSYPVHSFSAWMKEFRMLGYLGRVQELEKRLATLSPEARCLWLLAINSDILSAAEKRSPVVQLRQSLGVQEAQRYRILRSERSHEGEEYLALLERCALEGGHPVELDAPESGHMIKAKGRLAHLKSLESRWSSSTPSL